MWTPCDTQIPVSNAAVSITALQDEEDDAYKMVGISQPHGNDVLMGRGGKNNQHEGNEQLREIGRERYQDYREASKKGKSEISRELVKIVRELTPPGRCVVYEIVGGCIRCALLNAF
jgi:hypothetical protein